MVRWQNTHNNALADTFSRTIILLHLLKDLGTQIPIEFHYAGSELTPGDLQLLRDLGATPNDLSGPHNLLPAASDEQAERSYHLKIAAIINAKCVECLSLDSDNLPVKNPDYLFKSKVYTKTGAVFWPDFWKTEAENPIWEVIDRPCENELEQESGQVLVNKNVAWR
jgi:hypothetical protein